MAERLVASLSNHRVMVTSSYTGEELVLFGSVERDAATVPRRGPYDIVATVTGPRQSLRTRRKERVLGIWVNVSSREFVNPPSYLAVLQSHPLDAIANAENRKKLQLGLANTPLPEHDSQRSRRREQRSVPRRLRAADARARAVSTRSPTRSPS